MSFDAGYLTTRELEIWKLRRKGHKQVDIAEKLGVQRQGVNRSLLSIDSKIGQALNEAASLNKLDVWGVDLENGIIEAFSQAHQVPAIVSFSENNGVQVWYLYEGNCNTCNRLDQCKLMLLAEAEERDVVLTEEEKEACPTDIAKKIFTKYSKLVKLHGEK